MQNDVLYNRIMKKIDELEPGGGGAVIITDDGTSLDKTYAEIYDLINSGTPCYISWTGDASDSDLDSVYSYSVSLMPICYVYKYDDTYRVIAYCGKPANADNTIIGSPCTYTYQVSSSEEYPIFLRKAGVLPTALNVDNFR